MNNLNDVPVSEKGVSIRDGWLDAGVGQYVNALRQEGIETFESCEGGPGHAFPECTVRFYGGRGEGFRAFAIAVANGFEVSDLVRIWPIVEGEPTGPWWQIVFKKPQQSPADA